MPEPTDDDLNTMYDAALAFGPDWRRPLLELAGERLPQRSADYRAAVAALIEACRGDIEEFIDSEYRRLAGRWSPGAGESVDAWIVQHYGWMTAQNRKHAISQGIYYAWHG
jgi:hypothetical protein